jgi:hypothetical protein
MQEAAEPVDITTNRAEVVLEDSPVSVTEGMDDGSDVVETPAETPQEETAETPEAEVNPQAFEVFKDVLRTQYGVTPEDLKSGIEFMKGQMEQQAAVSAYKTLQETWGVDSNQLRERMEAVQEVFSQMSPEEQASMDNVQGAVAIWNSIVKNGRAQGMLGKTGSSARVPQNKYKFTAAQIAAMSEAERRQRDPEIVAAYAQGLVKE